MRVLFMCMPGVGHVAIATTLARAARLAGHEVLLLTGSDFCQQALDAGVDAAPIGPSRADARKIELERFPESPNVEPRLRQQFYVPSVSAGIYAPWMTADALPIIDEWGPDLVVFGTSTFAGPLVATLRGLPAASLGFGPALPIEVIKLADDKVASVWNQYSIQTDSYAGLMSYPNIDIWPDRLRLANQLEPSVRYQMRSTDQQSAQGIYAVELPEELTHTELPVVHVTVGTVLNRDQALLRAAISAYSDIDALVVLTTGPNRDPADLGLLPSTVRAYRFLPHTKLMKICSAVISHGGAGTTLAALSHGVPSVLIPQSSDHFQVADSCSQAGVSVSLDQAAVDPKVLRSALSEVLDNVSYSNNARKL